jgi:hypothetical protein
VPTSDLGHLVVRHGLFAVLLVLGLVLRARSSYGVGSWQLVGLLAVAAGYVVLVRWGCWRWLAALATIPGLADVRMLDDQAFAVVLALLLVSALTLLLGYSPEELPGPHFLPAVATALLALAIVVIGLVLAHGHQVVAVDPDVPGMHAPMLLLDLFLLVGALGTFGLWRARPIALRLVCGLLVVVAAVGTVSEVVWAPMAGALGLTALLRGRRGKSASVPQSDNVDEAALAAFARSYGPVRLAPVAIVIAAYNEADGLPGVVGTLPAEVCGLETDVVVVDDGSVDGTAASLDGTRAHVVACRANRGQGAALRLGYRVAREYGASYVITTDADGQYDVADMPAVLTPVLEDRADFVTGSRVLGAQHTTDHVRRAGVHVFAWLATILTGRRFTDTSFGLRAMRADVTATITLNQPQYQSSELLLGVVSHGFRVLEVPGTMRVRSAGSTKKGRNLVYGRRYARAMTGTWWREGCPRPVTEVAPALRHTRGHAPEVHAV